MITRVKIDVIAVQKKPPKAIDVYARKRGFELFFDAPDDESYLLSEFGSLTRRPSMGFLISQNQTSDWMSCDEQSASTGC